MVPCKSDINQVYSTKQVLEMFNDAPKRSWLFCYGQLWSGKKTWPRTNLSWPLVQIKAIIYFPETSNRNFGNFFSNWSLVFGFLETLFYKTDVQSERGPGWPFFSYILDVMGLFCFGSLQNLLACFHSGSDSFSGDACEVKVAAPSHSPSAEAEYWRIKAMAQQVGTTSLSDNGEHSPFFLLWKSPKIL